MNSALFSIFSERLKTPATLMDRAHSVAGFVLCLGLIYRNSDHESGRVLCFVRLCLEFRTWL